MNIQEISVLTILLLLLLAALFFLRLDLKDLRTKIKLAQNGKSKNKKINRMIKRMDKYSKYKFYCIQGIMFYGLTISTIFGSLYFVEDVFFNDTNRNITEFIMLFMVYFVIFSVYGIIYAKTAWKTYKSL